MSIAVFACLEKWIFYKGVKIYDGHYSDGKKNDKVKDESGK
tara:strand:+ start:221 stop:343 length:123 start_codon:yes stop_codon:yes gene_type:complete